MAHERTPAGYPILHEGVPRTTENLFARKKLPPLPSEEETRQLSGQSPTNPLLKFSSTLEEAVNLARIKRNKVFQQLLGQSFEPGTITPSSLGSMFGSLEQASTQFVKPLVETAGKLLEPETTGDIRQFQDAKVLGLIPKDMNFFDFQKKNAEARREERSNITEITSDDKRNLIGAGLTLTEISQIENDINQYGIDKVLEGIDDSIQKKAIQKVYGVQEKVTREQIESMTTQKIAQKGLKETYTDEELSEIARKNGFALWFTGKEGEIEKFLNSDKAKELYVDILYKQYQEAGLIE